MTEFQKSRFCEVCESKYAGSGICPYCGGKEFAKPITEKPKKVEEKGK